MAAVESPRAMLALAFWRSRNNYCGAVYCFVLDRLKSLIGLGQWKDRDLRADADVVRNFQEIAGVGAGHIGDAAYHALAPQEFVVIELGHVIQMNGVDRDYSAFAKTCQRADHDISAGSECDGAIKFDRRLFIFVSYPRGAKRGGQLSMGNSSG